MSDELQAVYLTGLFTVLVVVLNGAFTRLLSTAEWLRQERKEAFNAFYEPWLHYKRTLTTDEAHNFATRDFRQQLTVKRARWEASATGAQLKAVQNEEAKAFDAARTTLAEKLRVARGMGNIDYIERVQREVQALQTLEERTTGALIPATQIAFGSRTPNWAVAVLVLTVLVAAGVLTAAIRSIL